MAGNWGETITIDGLNITNKGFRLQAISEEEEDEVLRLKGYQFTNKLQVKYLGKGKHRSFVKRLSISPMGTPRVQSPLSFNSSPGENGSPKSPMSVGK